MYFDNAEGMVFRPPSEARSLILRVTIGCSHNRCAFCSMYRDVAFRTRSGEEIAGLIARAARLYPDQRRIFLADGDALVLDTDKLLIIMEMLHKSFPKLSRITCYGSPKNILRKTPQELRALHEAGLQIIYLGIESGDDGVLKAVDKGATAAQIITSGQKVLAAGIKLSAMVILGLGGRERTAEHAKNTAVVVSAINPTMLSALTLMLHPGTQMRTAADQGKFTPLSPYELMLELETMLRGINLAGPCLFRSNHVSNFLPLAGTLPEDKEKLLRDVAVVIERVKEQTIPTFNDRPDF